VRSSRFLIFASLTLLIGYLLSLFILNPGATSVKSNLSSVLKCDEQTRTGLPASLYIEGQSCPSVVELVLNLQRIETKNQAALVGTLRVWPAGEIGQVSVNAGVSQRSLRITYENLKQSDWLIEPKRLIGSRTLELSLPNRSAISSYPLDSYKSSWQAQVIDFQTGKPLPTTLTISNRPVYGWQISVKDVALESDLAAIKTVNLEGDEKVEWVIERSSSTKLSSALLLLVMMLAAVAAIMLSKSIFLRKRPPTLVALSWLATSLFAVIEIRGRFPDSPPLGIRVDTFVTYPVILTLLFLIAAHTYLWVKRDDWNMKNLPDDQITA
jgi:hypothetical protein